MKQRVAEKYRKTTETTVRAKLNLDGRGRYRVSTTIPFLDHMLELFAKHGNFDLGVKAKGDTHIDDHHLVEDIGITLGLALDKALGDKKGIYRYGNFLLPMDETLSYVAVDCGGRPYFDYEVPFKPQSKAPFCFELFEDFFMALAFNAKMNLHMKLVKGRNNHHIAEALFKGFAKAMAQAVGHNPKLRDVLPSTKGTLTK